MIAPMKDECMSSPVRKSSGSNKRSQCQQTLEWTRTCSEVDLTLVPSSSESGVGDSTSKLERKMLVGDDDDEEEEEEEGWIPAICNNVEKYIKFEIFQVRKWTGGGDKRRL